MGVKRLLLSRFLTLVAAFVGIIVVAIAIAADSKSITLKPTKPFFDLDDGLVLLHWALVISVVYFSGVMFLKARCFRIFENKMLIATLTEPHTMMQILTLGPALLSVIWKNELMSTNNNGIINGLTSISIAMAAGVLVIQIGSDGETYFGQFATMFHLTLKKIPAHVFAVIYLLHGFSFGFWLLENRLATADGEQDFTDYWKSIITVFSMAFGLAEFNFDGAFKYREEDYWRAHQYHLCLRLDPLHGPTSSLGPPQPPVVVHHLRPQGDASRGCPEQHTFHGTVHGLG